jgi:hypothetical protein
MAKFEEHHIRNHGNLDHDYVFYLYLVTGKTTLKGPFMSFIGRTLVWPMSQQPLEGFPP